MEIRNLDLTILSADDLSNVNLFSKMDVYVVVSLLDAANPHLPPSQKQKTPIQKKAHKSPTWNHTLTFNLDDAAASQNRLSLLFKIYSRHVLLPDTLIGDVRVSVSELLSGAGYRKESSFQSYQLRKRSRTPRGVLNFSYKFGEKFSVAGHQGGPTSSYGWGQPVMAYPPGGGYGYGYGYPYQGQGYGYGQGYPVQGAGGRTRRNNFGMGMGAGLLGGALAGMLIGDVVSDAAFDGGGCGGGFDGGGCGGGGFDF